MTGNRERAAYSWDLAISNFNKSEANQTIYNIIYNLKRFRLCEKEFRICRLWEGIQDMLACEKGFPCYDRNTVKSRAEKNFQISAIGKFQIWWEFVIQEGRSERSRKEMVFVIWVFFPESKIIGMRGWSVWRIRTRKRFTARCRTAASWNSRISRGRRAVKNGRSNARARRAVKNGKSNARGQKSREERQK